MRQCMRILGGTTGSGKMIRSNRACCLQVQRT